MGLLSGGLPHCKQCGYELEGGEEECPRCGFNPKMKGLRVSLGFLLVVVVSVTLSMFAPTVFPASGPVLVAAAAIAFPISVVTLFVSFIVTPYRFGRPFTWF